MRLNLHQITLLATIMFVLLSMVASSFFYYIPLWRHRKIYGRFYKRPHYHHVHHGWGHHQTVHHGHGHHHGHHGHGYGHGWGWSG